MLILTKGGHISLNQMGEILILPTTVRINESSMANILYFAEFSNISGVSIKMNTSKAKVVNVQIQDSQIIHFKACEKGLFKKN